jgi:hypothetical protein
VLNRSLNQRPLMAMKQWLKINGYRKTNYRQSTKR